MATLARIGKVHTLTIANGAATSDILDLMSENRRPLVLTVYGPAALTNTVTVQISFDGTNFQTLQSPSGTDLAIVAAKCLVLSALGPCYFKFLSSGNEGAARTFYVVASSLNGS